MGDQFIKSTKNIEQANEIIDLMTPGQTMNTLISEILKKPLLDYSSDFQHVSHVLEWCIDNSDGDLFLEYWSDREWFVCNRDFHTRQTDNEFGYVIHARSNKVTKDGCHPSLPLAICRYMLKSSVNQGFISPQEIIRRI